MSRNIVLTGITLYKKTGISKMLSFVSGSSCRFTPTCSDYTYQAISRYGTIRGLFMGVKRIARCHPFAKSGFDPVQ